MASSCPAAAALLLLLLPLRTWQVEVHYIHWNASNPDFSQHGGFVIDVDLGEEPWQYHQANIICPYYPEESGLGGGGGARGDDGARRFERYVVRNVTREEYERCRLLRGRGDLRSAGIVAVCDSPRKLSYFTMTFRKYSPTPNGFEFSPGRDYFLISTSSRGDLYGADGGSCAEDDMRLRFRMRRKARRRKQEGGRGAEVIARGGGGGGNQVPDEDQEEEEEEGRRPMESTVAAGSGGGGRLLSWTTSVLCAFPLFLLCLQEATRRTD